MSNIWKRALSMFLAVVMVLGNVPVQAFATETEHNHEESAAVETTVAVTEAAVTEAVSAETTAASAATKAPETEAPETEAPTTEAPETEAPTTEAPETEALETEAPETEAPTTEAVEETTVPETTAAPETTAPAVTEAETEPKETLSGEEREIYYVNLEAWEEVWVSYAFEEKDFADVDHPGVEMEYDEEYDVWAVKLPAEADEVCFNDGIDHSEDETLPEGETAPEEIYEIEAELDADSYYDFYVGEDEWINFAAWVEAQQLDEEPTETTTAPVVEEEEEEVEVVVGGEVTNEAQMAEADGWYWDETTLYIKDGKITKAQLYNALHEKINNTKSGYKYNGTNFSRGTQWISGGTEVKSGTSGNADLAEGTWYIRNAGTALGSPSYSAGSTTKITVKHYYVITVDVVGASTGSVTYNNKTYTDGQSFNYINGTSAITLNSVTGYNAPTASGTPATVDTTPTASGTLTVTYTVPGVTKYNVSAEVTAGSGTATVSPNGSVADGTTVTITATPSNATGYVKSVKVNGTDYVTAEAVVSGSFANCIYTGSVTVDGADIAVEVEFAERTIEQKTTSIAINGHNNKRVASYKEMLVGGNLVTVSPAVGNFTVLMHCSALANAGSDRINVNSLGTAHLLSICDAPVVEKSFDVTCSGTDRYPAVSLTGVKVTLTESRTPPVISNAAMTVTADTQDDFVAAVKAQVVTRLNNSGITADNISVTLTSPTAYNGAGTYQVTVKVTNDGETWIPSTDATAASITVTASVNNYTVTWNNEGVEEKQTLAYGTEPTAPKYTKTGYTLSWNPEIVAVTADATYTAVWTPNKYTIAFDGNGSTSGETAAISNVAYDADQVLTENSFTKTGYTFAGWAASAEGAVVYADKASVKNLTAENGVTVTLYAKWTPITYTVNYHGNTNTSGSTASSTHTYDAESSLTANGFVKTGYTFTGWNTKADGTGDSYADGVKVTQLKNTAGSVDLYAQWSENGYTVAYDANGGTGTMASVGYTYTESKALTDNVFTREGYTFTGWNTKADGSGIAYSDGQTVSMLTDVNNATVTLYAQWDANEYTITFDTDGGSAIANITADYGAAITKPADPTKTGYTFAGWDTNGNNTIDDADVFPTTMPLGGLTVKAIWTAIDYTITFDPNGGEWKDTTITSDVVTYTKHYGDTVTAPAVTKAGYNFGGWNPAFSGTVTGNADYKAQWVEGNTVTWIVDGKETVNAYTTGAEVPAPTVTKDGYTFVGWDLVTNADGTGDGVADTPIAEMGTEDVTYVALWTAHTYTVVYNGNGNTSGSMQSSSHTYDVEKALTANGFVKTGYTFAGWATSADGEAVYKDGASVENLTKENGGTVTLYAVWTVNQYTITFADTGDVTYEAITQDYGTDIAPIANPTKTGYTFDKWDTTIPATMPAENITITALWKINQYTITFDTDGGTEIAAITGDYQSAVTAPADPTREGYTFKSWDRTIPTTMPAEDITITAQWEINQYTITFANTGDSNIKAITQNYGTTITAPADPTWAKHIFAGWDKEIPNTMPAENMTITAEWKDDANENVVDDTTEQLTVNINGGTFKLDGTELAAGTHLYDSTKAHTITVTPSDLDGSDGSAGYVDSVTNVTDGKYENGVYTATLPANKGNSVTVNVTIKTASLTQVDGGILALNGYVKDGTIKDYSARWDNIDAKTLKAVVGVEDTTGYTVYYWLDLTGDAADYYTSDHWRVDLQRDRLNVPAVGTTGTQKVKIVKAASGDGKIVALTLADVNVTTKESRDVTTINASNVILKVESKDAVTKDAILAKLNAQPATVTVKDYQGNPVENIAFSNVTLADFTYDALPAQGQTNSFTLKLSLAGTDTYVGATKNITVTVKYIFDENNNDIDDDEEEKFTITYTDGVENEEIFADQTANILTGLATPAFDNGVAPTREGYTFIGWHNSATNTTGVTVDVTVDKAVTYTAQWRIKQYTITFADTGDVTYEAITQDYGTDIAPIANPTKTGYTFTGWDKEIPDTMPAENVTITAQWKVNQYTISFDTDGGSAIAPITQDYGTAVTAPADPTKTGYTFAGWDKSVPGTMPAEDMTITANWTINQYTIRFADTGDSTIAPITEDYGTAIGAVADPTKTGYTFIGWDEEIPGTMPAGDMTITAQWKVNQYTITFDTDGGSEIEAIKQDYGTAITKPANPTKEGYTFAGWVDANGQSAQIPDTMPAGDLTLTATWTIGAYTITWKIDENTNHAVTGYDYQAAVSAPADPTKPGYTFAGWNQEIPETMPAENLVITANWTINQYTITFDTDGGSEVAAIKQDYNTAVTVPADPTKTGYTFAGWNPQIPTTMPAKDQTIKATWTINQYTITFDTDGGTTIAPIKQDYNTAVTNPNVTPAKTGYTFAGWDVDGDGDSDTDDVIPATMPAENVVIKALWTVNQYTITFDTDGGTTIAPIKQDYNTAVTNPNVTPAKTGYTFAGWNPQIPATMPAKDQTIKATWTINQYTVAFNTNGGTAVSSVTANYGSDVYQPTGVPTKDGCVFEYWKDADGNQVTFPVTMPENGMTLYAHWAADVNGNKKPDYNETATVRVAVEGEGSVALSIGADKKTVITKKNDGTYTVVYNIDDSTSKTITVTATPTDWSTAYNYVASVKVDDVEKTSGLTGFANGVFTTTMSVENSGVYEVEGVFAKRTLTAKNADVAVNAYYASPYTIPVVNKAGTSWSRDEYGANMTADKFIRTATGGDTSKIHLEMYYTTISLSGTNSGYAKLSDIDTVGKQFSFDPPECTKKVKLVWEGDARYPTVTSNEVNAHIIEARPSVAKVAYTGNTIVANNLESVSVSTANIAASGSNGAVGTIGTPVYKSGDFPTTVDTVVNLTYTVTIAANENYVETTKNITVPVQLATYTVTWKHWNGTPLETDKNVPYGATPSYDGSNPETTHDVATTYTWNGAWDKEIAAVSGNVTYTAAYTESARLYTISWDLNGDGDVDKTTEVGYGSVPVAPNDEVVPPANKSHLGWEPALAEVTGEQTYTATFSDDTIYTITFVVDGSTYETQSINVTKNPTATVAAVANPDKDYAVFGGWDTDIIGKTPTSSMQVNATWLADTNNNNVEDTDETITVTVTGKGALTIDGDTVTTGSYVYDSTLENHTFVATPDNTDGTSDGDASYVQSLEVARSGNVATADAAYGSDYSLTHTAALSKGNAVSAVFGTATLAAQNATVNFNAADALATLRTDVLKASGLSVLDKYTLTTVVEVDLPVIGKMDATVVITDGAATAPAISETFASLVTEAVKLALRNDKSRAFTISQPAVGNQIPAISKTITITLTDTRPVAVIVTPENNATDKRFEVEFNDKDEIVEAIEEVVSAHYMLNGNKQDLTENLRVDLKPSSEVKENMDGQPQKVTYSVYIVDTDDLLSKEYIKPDAVDFYVTAIGIVHPAEVTVTNDNTKGSIDLASGEYDANQDKKLEFHVTPAEGHFVESVTVNGTKIEGEYSETNFSGSFEIVNGDYDSSLETEDKIVPSTYEVVVTYGQRQVVVNESGRMVSYLEEMTEAELLQAVYGAIVNEKESGPDIAYDDTVTIKPDKEITGLGKYTFTITWAATDKYPETSVTADVELVDVLVITPVIEELIVDAAATADQVLAAITEIKLPNGAGAVTGMVVDTDSLAAANAALVQGKTENVKVVVTVSDGTAFLGGDFDVEVPVTGKIELPNVVILESKLEDGTVTGTVNYTAPDSGSKYEFAVAPAKNYFVDTMVIEREFVAPEVQTAAAANAYASLIWSDFTENKVSVDLENGENQPLGVVPTYYVTTTFVDPAITIEENAVVNYNPYTTGTSEKLVAEIVGDIKPEADPEELLKTDAAEYQDVLGESNEVEIQYMARAADEKVHIEYTINLLMWNYTLDYDIALGEVWKHPGEVVTQTEGLSNEEIDAMIKEIIDDLDVDVSEIISNPGGFIGELKERLKVKILPYYENYGVHAFGENPPDANGDVYETVRVISTSDRFGEVSSNTAKIKLVDTRTPTSITVNSQNVEMVYGFAASDLLAALNPVVNAEDGTVVTEPAVSVVTKVEGMNVQTEAYEVVLKYPGNEDYKTSTLTVLVTVKKDTATVTVESKVVKYTGEPVQVEMSAVGDTYGKEAEIAKFIVGLDLSNLAINTPEAGDLKETTVVGLKGTLTLILPESLQQMISMAEDLAAKMGLDLKLNGMTMSVAELKSTLERLLGLLDMTGEGNATIDALINVLNMLPTDVADLSITLGTDASMPKDVGVYLTGAVTVDANFETAFNIGYLVITPDGHKAEIDWIVEDTNGIISYNLLQDPEKYYDMGVKVTKVYEGTIEEAQQYATQIFLGITTQGEIKLTTDQKDLPFGAYVEIGLLNDLGNIMYYAEPIVRAFVVVPETVDVQLLDANGNANNDLLVEFDNKPHGFEVMVSEREGAVILNTYENVGSTENLILHYYGLQTNINPYDSSEEPVHAGGYAAVAIYLEKDAQGNIVAFGMDAGAMAIKPTESTVAVENRTGIEDGTKYYFADQVTAGSTVEGLKPDTTVISAAVTSESAFIENGWDSVQGNVNVDFPEWVNDLLSKYAPSLLEDEMTAGEFADKVVGKMPAITAKLQELGISTDITDVLNSVVDEVASIVSQIPENITISFQDNAYATDTGIYVVAGVVTDSDHIPSVDVGTLIITANMEVKIYNNGVEDPKTQHTYDGTPKSVGEIRIFDLEGNEIFCNPEEGDQLTVTYYGVDTGTEGYKGGEPTNSGGYVALVTFTNYDADGNYLGMAVTVGAMIIKPTEATLVAEDKTVTYNGEEQFLDICLDDGKQQISTDYAALVMDTNNMEYTLILEDDLNSILSKIEQILGRELPEEIDLDELMDTILETMEKIQAIQIPEEVQTVIDKLPENLRNPINNLLGKVENELMPILQKLYDMLVKANNAMPTIGTVKINGSKPVNVGVYQVYVLSVSENYMPAVTDGVLEIKPVYVHVTVLDAEKFFGETDEQADPKMDYAVEFKDYLGNTVTTETEVTVELTRNPGEDVGTYEIYATVTLTDDSGNFVADVPTEGVFTIKPVEAVITAPTGKMGLTYNGEAQALIETAGSVVGGTMQYSLSNAEDAVWFDAEAIANAITGKDAGTYTVYYKVVADSNHTIDGVVGGTLVKSIAVEIGKADATVTEAPAGKTLTYDTKNQILIAAGSAEGGTMLYKLGEDGTWSNNPNVTGKDAGTYTIYYMVEGDANHNSSEVSSVETVINPAKVTITVAPATKVYGDEDPDYPALTVTAEEPGAVSDEELNARITGRAEGEDVNDNGYAYVVAYDESDNYEVEVTTNVLMITPAKVDVYFTKNATINCKDEDPDFMDLVTARGLKFDDTVADLGLKFSREEGDTANTSSAAAKRYNITAEADGTNKNYSVTVVGNGILIIMHKYEAVVTEPTCTDRGYTTNTCVCGYSYVNKYVNKLGHAMGDWTETKAPTCTAAGEERRDCTRCDYFETKKKAMVDHSYEAVVTEPTCTEQGYTTYTCTCGDSYVADYVDAKGHAMGDWTETKAPTCTAAGEERRECANCDHYETRVVDAAGHDYQAVVTEPTCTEEGYTTYTCSVCGDNYKDDYVDAKGHAMGEWKQTKAPSCTEAGEERRDCANCDHYETRTVAATGHDHKAVVTEPTCTEQGYTTYTCACGDSYVSDYVDAKGHAMGKWTETKAPNCTEAGEERRDCANCDHFETRTVAATGHDHKAVVTDPTCTEQGYTTYTCACGDSYVSDYVDAKGHAMGEWAETKAPTCTEAGEERRDCANCDHYETRTVPAHGHKDENPKDYICDICEEDLCKEEDHEKETIPGYAATCEKDGLTDGEKCSKCGEILTAQQVIPASGHAMGDWAETKAPTCTEAGEERRDCANCDHYETRTVEATGHDYKAVVTDPTCTEQGYTTYTCACGDSYVSDYVDAKGHAMGEWKQTKAPTCTEAGEERRDCANCDHFETRTVAATGHDYKAVVTEPTCTEQGYTTYTCACGDSYVSDYVDAKGHAMGEWAQTKAPSCTEAGEERRDCVNCDHYETRVVEATGHDYKAVVTEPTCTEQGYTTYTCACGDSYVFDYVDAKGHAMGEWAQTKAPTCTEAGEERRDCANCDHYETRTVAATGHDYKAVVTDPTCTKQGYTTYTCACGDSYVSDYVDAKGHAMGEWVQTKAPTCTEEGEERSDCANCDHYETRIVEAAGHDYQAVVTEPTCTEQGYTTYTCACGDRYVADYVDALGHSEETIPAVAPGCTATGLTEGTKCSVCGKTLVEQEEIPATGHTMGEWVVTKEPTETENGEKRRDCEVCDYFETEEIPALGESEPTKKTITEDDVKLDGQLTYNGKKQTQKVIVTVDGVVLVEGVDYEITKNTGKNAGKYTLTITGKGDYEGSVELKWTIKAAKVTIKMNSHKVTVGDKLPKWTYKVTSGQVFKGDTLKLATSCEAKNTKKTGTFTITAKDNDPNYIITVKNGKLTVVEKKDEHKGLYPVPFNPKDSSGTIKPGATVEIDGVPYTMDEDCIVWLDHTKAKLATTYKYKVGKNAHESYPTNMYVWELTITDTDGDKKYDMYDADRVKELDNFLKYEGTSIRVNFTSNGIRFFTSMPKDGRTALIKGKLLKGDLAGYKLVRAGTLFKWYDGNESLTMDTGVSSDVYGGKAGTNFRVFSSTSQRDWYTGMLTGLGGDAKTLNKDVMARPYIVLERNGEQITIYGGSIQRSIYYVATQNKDYWNAGTAYDNYVEGIIATVKKAKGK